MVVEGLVAGLGRRVLDRDVDNHRDGGFRNDLGAAFLDAEPG